MKHFAGIILALLMASSTPALAIQQQEHSYIRIGRRTTTSSSKKEHRHDEEQQEEQHRALKPGKKCKNTPDIFPHEKCSTDKPICVSETGEELPFNVEVKGSKCVTCRNSQESDDKIDEGCSPSKPRCVLTEDGTEVPDLGFAGEHCLEQPIVSPDSLPDAYGVFHKCVRLQDGTSHYIDANRECETGMMRISFSQVGPQGPQGLQGPQGEQGAVGADGPQGPQGEMGIPGIQGIQGIQGIPGLQGIPGEEGARGEKGETGLQGAEGPTGADGAQGPQGVPGPVGANGRNGVDGVDGAQGRQGPQGPEGPSLASDSLITSMCEEYFLELDICKKYIFVTGSGYAANFNVGSGRLRAMDAIDAVCQETAESAGLPGLYYGWFSTSDSDSPASRFHQSAVPYIRPDGITLANDWDDLVDGTLEVGYFTDEFGKELTAINGDIHVDNLPIATNTKDDGSHISNEIYGNCDDFSTLNPNTKPLVAGVLSRSYGTNRLENDATKSCAAIDFRFLCVQQ